MRAVNFMLAACLAAPTPPPPSTPPAQVPAGVILVKGAWSSTSDSTTPVPEGGKASSHDYYSPYFRLTYPFAAGWKQPFEGPPPSDRGYYVLAQIEPTGEHVGSVLIEAQDLFFTATPVNNTLRADYRMERPMTTVTLAGRSFARLDSVSPVTGLHSSVLATQIRCHAVKFTLTSTDPKVVDQLVTGLRGLAIGDERAPVCVKDYASGTNVLNRIDPILTDRRFNSIPVRILIDTSGKVKFIHFISAFPDQARAITDALQQWRFKPYVSDGRPVEVETGILFGVQPPSKPLISGKQDPQLPPARKHDTT